MKKTITYKFLDSSFDDFETVCLLLLSFVLCPLLLIQLPYFGGRLERLHILEYYTSQECSTFHYSLLAESRFKAENTGSFTIQPNAVLSTSRNQVNLQVERFIAQT